MENFKQTPNKAPAGEEGVFPNTEENVEKMAVTTRAVLDGVFTGLFKPEFYTDASGEERVRVKNDKGELLYDDTEIGFHALAEGVNLSRDSQIFQDLKTKDQ